MSLLKPGSSSKSSHIDGEALEAGRREKKSGVFASKSGKKARAQDASGSTELAKLLGNRTRALLAFEDAGFDASAFMSAYLAPLSEKALDNARQDLGALLATATEEVESVVQQHHQRFLQACAGVEALEDQVALLRNYTNGLTALVASLKSALSVQVAPRTPRLSTGAASAGWHTQHSAPSPVVNAGSASANSTVAQIEADMELLLQELDLASAARDLRAAVSWLRACEAVGSLLDRDAPRLVLVVDDFPGWRHSYDAAVGLRKQCLVAALQRQLADANASGCEIRSATRALSELVGEPSALQAMLHCYSHKVRLSQALVLKQHAAGSDPDSLDFAGGLMQRTLLEVAAASDDLVAIFGVAQREPASLFAVWAAREARCAAIMLRRHVLNAAAAASMGLHTAVQVVAMCLVLSCMLEASHSISLTATLTTELWPSVDGALRRHLKRLTDELRMAATEEINSLVLSTLSGGAGGGGGPAAGGTSVQVPGLVTGSSLCKEVGLLAELLAPIASPKLAATFKRALTDLFTAATQTISFTLKSHMESSASAAGKLAPLLPGVMEVLAGLIEDQLRQAVAPFVAHAGPVIDTKAMDRALSVMYAECTRAAK